MKQRLKDNAITENISVSKFEQSDVLYENAKLVHSSIRHDGTTQKTYDIFLSHSSLDKQLVLSLVNLFNKAGFSVYVDWIEDPQMDRSNVTPATARTLRYRMNQSKGLAYVATSNTSYSKWCPWELGYFDGNKNGRCCILPVLDSENSVYKGQEYLGLYPYLDYAKEQESDCHMFWVNDSIDYDKYVELEDWLNGEDTYKNVK